MESATGHARRRIGDALYETMLRQPGPARASLVLRALPQDLGVASAAARDVLDTDPRFILRDGRHDLKARAETPGAGFNASIERILTELGRPPDVSDIAAFFASATDHDAQYYENLIARLLEREALFFAVDGKLLPASWLLIPEGDDEDDVLFYCDLDTDEELAQFRPSCADDSLRTDTPLDTAVNVVTAAGAPIRNRILGFFVYRLHPDEFDPFGLLSAMLRDERVYATPELRWVSGEIQPQVEAALAELDRSAVAHEPAPAVDLEPILAKPLPPDHPGYFIQDDDLRMIYELVNTSKQPVSVAELLFEVLELSPDASDLVPAAHSVRDLLHHDPAILDVGPATFLGPAGIPQWVKQIPEGLIPVPGKPGEDVILMEEGLRPGLADRVHDPFLEDVGDDDVIVDDDVTTSDETFYTLPFAHRAAGTMKLRRMDLDFFGLEAPIAPVKMVDEDGEEHQVWVNTETRLLLGLQDLYAKLELTLGALIAITPGEGPGQFNFVAAGEDDASAVEETRLQQLIALRENPDTAGKSLFELIRELMRADPEGARFEMLHAELNVIRRTTRLQLASLLSYYQCFRPKDSQGDDWAYAQDAVAAGAIPTKEKFVITSQGDTE